MLKILTLYLQMMCNHISYFHQIEHDFLNETGPKQSKKKNSWSADPADGQSVLL
jgi:hypothetical protein